MRLRAKNGISYPVGDALALVRQHGGLTKVPKGAKVPYKRVEAGGFCDDLPEESIALLLQRGDIEIVDEAPKAAPKTRKGA